MKHQADKTVRGCFTWLGAFTLAFTGLFVLYWFVAARANSSFAGVIAVALAGVVVGLVFIAFGR